MFLSTCYATLSYTIIIVLCNLVIIESVNSGSCTNLSQTGKSVKVEVKDNDDVCMYPLTLRDPLFQLFGVKISSELRTLNSDKS